MSERDKNSIHSGHRGRIRLRFETEGLASFAPHEVLEFLLFYVISYRDTNELAHRLLDKFGRLDRVLDADISSLTEVDGIGYNAAVFLKLIPQAAQYYVRERFQEDVRIENSEQMGKYMCSRIGFYANEVFAVSAFDSRRRETAFEILDKGIVSQTTVHMRRLAEFAIAHRAEMLVIAHNHVTGEPIPSQADRETTKRICVGLRQIGITVSDHIIVSGEKYYSFSENGIMPI